MKKGATSPSLASGEATQLLVDDSLEDGKVSHDCLPHAIEANIGVSMSPDVAEVANLTPGDLGMACLKFLGEVTRGISQRLHAAEHGILGPHVVVEELLVQDALDAREISVDEIDTLRDVPEIDPVISHTGTAS